MEEAAATNKKSYLSKTLWISAITAVAPLFTPGLSAWISSNPELFSGIVGILFTALRVVTKDKLVIK